MNKRIKYISSVILVVLSLVLTSSYVLAEVDTNVEIPKANFQDFSISGEQPSVLATQAMNWFFVIAAFLCIAIIVWAGVTYATAGGDEEKTTKAKQRLIYGIIGIAVVVAAYAITTFIKATLTGGGAGIPAPTL
ncbi:MAG: pilin [bacterium]|nr:pilin [bacterium]